MACADVGVVSEDLRKLDLHRLRPLIESVCLVFSAGITDVLLTCGLQGHSCYNDAD